MWINKNISNPLKKGYYKTLVDYEGFGNLMEIDNELFNGDEWDLCESDSQFIQYWWASKEDFEIVSNKIEDEFNNFLDMDT